MVTVRTFIFHRSILCDETFLLVTSSKPSARSRSFFKVILTRNAVLFTLDIIFEWYDMGGGALYLKHEFIVIRLSVCYKFKVIIQGQGQLSGYYSCKMRTLPLDTTFEWYDIEPSHLTCEILVTRP